MAIALRESRSGLDASTPRSRAHPQPPAGHFGGRSGIGAAGDASVLPALRRRLCAAIREGKFDDAQAPALMAHLVRTASDWVAISNPKALRPEPPQHEATSNDVR